MSHVPSGLTWVPGPKIASFVLPIWCKRTGFFSKHQPWAPPWHRHWTLELYIYTLWIQNMIYLMMTFLDVSSGAFRTWKLATDALFQDISRKGIFRQTLGLFRQILRYFQQTLGFFINQPLTLFTTTLREKILQYSPSRRVTVRHAIFRQCLAFK